MNKSERYVYEAIKNWVWSGFYNEADIQEMMDDILDGNCDEKCCYLSWLKNLN